MVVRPKYVAVNMNKIVNNQWNSIVLDGNPWTRSNTRNRMQTTKFKMDYNAEINSCRIDSVFAF
jgi:hypothetical protein